MPGGSEWLIIAGIVLLIFGGSKLPQLARSLGRAKTEFHKGAREGSADDAPSAAEASQNSDG